MADVFKDRILDVPFALASATVLVTFLLFAFEVLGSQYDSLLVWEQTFGIASTTLQCEAVRTDKFIKRPHTATFSFAYILCAFAIITQTVRDLATLPQDRNAEYNLLEREMMWGIILALGPLSIGASSFMYLASNTRLFELILKCCWWITINLYSSYAWARLLQYKNTCSGSSSTACFSWTSALPLLVFALTLNILLVVFREDIVYGDGEVGMVFLLLCNIVLPIYLHWKLTFRLVRSNTAMLAFTTMYAMGAYVIYLFSSLPFLCSSPNGGGAQPYAAFQIFSALSIWQTYKFFRSDGKPEEYKVIVQNHRDRNSHDDMVLTSAYFVPDDDPYSRAPGGQGRIAAQATAVAVAPTSQPQRNSGRHGSVDSRIRVDSLRVVDSERRLHREGSTTSQGSDHSQQRRNLQEGSGRRSERRSRGNSAAGGGEIPIVMAEPARPLSGSASRNSFSAISNAATAAATAAPVNRGSQVLSSVAATSSSRPSLTTQLRQQQQPSLREITPPTARPTPNPPMLPERRISHLQVDPPRPRSMTGEDMDSGGGGRPSFVPGRSRRSSVDRGDSNPALRVLERGGLGERTVERERALSGAALDARTVQLRSPEEAQIKKQQILLSEASGGRLRSGSNASSVHTVAVDGAGADGAQLTTEQRLEALRRQRAQLQRERGASNYQ